MRLGRRSPRIPAPRLSRMSAPCRSCVRRPHRSGHPPRPLSCAGPPKPMAESNAGLPGRPETGGRTSGSSTSAVESASVSSGRGANRAIEADAVARSGAAPEPAERPSAVVRAQVAQVGTSVATAMPLQRASATDNEWAGGIPGEPEASDRTSGSTLPTVELVSEPSGPSISRANEPAIAGQTKIRARTTRAAPEQRLQPVFPGNKRNRLKPRLRKIIRTSLAPRIPALRLSRRSGQLPSCARRPHRVGRRSPSRCPCSEPPQMIRTSRAGPRTTRAAPEQRLQPVFPGNERNRLKPRLRKMIRTR